MLTLRQIVDEVNINVPNTFTDTQKVQWLDQLQRELYREFDLPEQIEQLDGGTGANQTFYTLPSYIVPNRIKSVVLTDADGKNPQEYIYAQHHEVVSGYSYTIIEAENVVTMALYPEPTVDGLPIMITFEDGPNTLLSSDMATVPRFFHDYHDILVNGLSRKVAQKMKQIDLANNYDSNFKEGIEKAKRYIYDSGPYQIQDVYGGDLLL